LGATSTPENEGECGEEEDEADDKCWEIAATREATGIVVSIDEALLLDGMELVLPGPPRALAVVARGAALARAREARGGGLARVMAQGGVGVGVGRGAQWALQRTRVKRVRSLLPVVR